MASPLVQAAIKTPGFLGLNTEQHAAQSQERFSTVLQNAVWTEGGKIVCRKGWSPSVTHTNPIAELFWWRKDRTTNKLMAVSEDEATELYEVTQTTNPYDTMTKIGDLSGTDVHFANVNGFLTISQQGYLPQYWDGTTLANFATATGTQANPQGGVSISAFGRYFITSSDGKTVWGSELQPNPSTGINWDNWFFDTTGNSGGTAKDGWVYGRDYITGLGAIGDMLIIFGTNSIIALADINGTPAIVDSITGVGCVNQKTIRNTGDDILFLSSSGVRSLLRTLAKETPSLNDISAFVRSDLLAGVTFNTAKAVYSEFDDFYLISDGSDTCYMFDLRQQLPSGARRTSDWTLIPDAFAYDPEENELYVAVGAKIGKYEDYLDDTSTYKLTLKSAWLDIQTSRIKIIKKLGAIIYGGDGYTPEFSLSFDYKEDIEDKFFGEALPVVGGDEWNVGEWGISEWAREPNQINRRYVQAAGSGLFVRYGIEFVVDQFEVGIQEVRMTAKIGKLSHV